MSETKILYLNEAQNRAVGAIRKFMDNTDKYNFLLLGPGGSGKTSTIVNTFNSNLYDDSQNDTLEPSETTQALSKQGNNSPDSKFTSQPVNQIPTNQSTSQPISQSSTNQSAKIYRLAFCAFTNKATQVLKNISNKFNILFSADFMTIHKLLMLEPKFLDTEKEIAFTFDKNKIEHLKNYDVIIFDECSTISKELYDYIKQAWDFMLFKYGIKLKFIFLGDYWQLPPVGEDSSVLFETAIREKWPVSKLVKVMRSGNETIYDINQNLLKWVDLFRENDDEIATFHKKYPYNLVPKNRDIYIKDFNDFVDYYLETWHDKDEKDVVMLTYSRANCEKINFALQDKLDTLADREIPARRQLVKFHRGDRCCLDKPIEVYSITRQLKSDGEEYVSLDVSTGESLYNGEIFDILYTEDVRIITPLNKASFKTPAYFDGQILTVRRISDPLANTYEILHIQNTLIDEARKSIRLKTARMMYLNIMSGFIKLYPKLDYGYCMTIYKSQGSEWHTTLVNLNSIKWSMVSDDKSPPLKKKKQLFKATYTALSRASHMLKLFWF